MIGARFLHEPACGREKSACCAAGPRAEKLIELSYSLYNNFGSFFFFNVFFCILVCMTRAKQRM